ncbi:MAG: DNA polymerase Y family protein [Phycisphaeraceae bacterium]|nr:DNA polymerase Y family protein [Phycisphaeraceae bacterium]
MHRMILSIDLPRWEVDLARRRAAHRSASPAISASSRPMPRARHKRAILIIGTRARQRWVVQCCPVAASRGVEPGMSLAHARALLQQRSFIAVDHQPAQARRALEALGRWAISLTPIVGLDTEAFFPAQPPVYGLLLDVTGCQWLHRGWARLIEKVRQGLEQLDIEHRLGMAPTVGAAWAMARFSGEPASIIQEPANIARAIDPLPVAALRLEPQAATTLAEVGIEQIGQIRAIRPASLHARFGPSVLDALHRALGQREEPVQPLRMLERVEVVRQPAGPVRQVEAVWRALREMLEVLCTRLEQLDQGVSTLVMKLVRCQGGPETRRIRLSRPSRDPAHLWTLLQPEAQHIDIGFGLDAIELHAADMGPIARTQGRLAAIAAPGSSAADRAADVGQSDQKRDETDAGNPAWRDDPELGQLLDRLTRRLGSRQVRLARLVARHQPEAAFVMLEAVEAATLQRGGRTDDDDDADARMRNELVRPTRLIHPPEPLTIIRWDQNALPATFAWRGGRYRIQQLHGPERIAPAWWTEPGRFMPMRDYYRALDDAGRWWWLMNQTTDEEPEQITKTHTSEPTNPAPANNPATSHANNWYIHGIWT